MCFQGGPPTFRLCLKMAMSNAGSFVSFPSTVQLRRLMPQPLRPSPASQVPVVWSVWYPSEHGSDVF